MSGHYRKKPVVIEALQWSGHNGAEVLAFTGLDGCSWEGERMFIKTLEGEMLAMPSDFIIKGIHGEFYPCKEEIFKKTYEMVVV